MANYDGLIFDLDGTLWDASEATALGWNAAIRNRGIGEMRVSGQDVRGVVGQPFERCIDILFPGLSPALRHALVPAFDQYERKEVERRGGRLYDGVQTGLKALSASYKVFIVSNCQDWYLESFLRQSQLRSCFSDVDCHGRSSRPKPEMIQNLMVRFGLSRPVYVGDTQADQSAASAAGAEFVHAAYGFGVVQDSPRAFASFPELVAWFRPEA
ncbi:MAG: HAD family hydrolase [Ectothiorhodospiraceae bacterium]|nr:HAD family hydrolase [Ectothiorhodospiraceae bacterium]